MDFLNILETVKTSCQALGVSDYELYYEKTESIGVEMLKNEISGFSSGEGAGVCLRVLFDGKIGYASGELFTEDEIGAMTLRALENAKNTEKKDSVGIFEGSKSYNECKMGNDARVLDTEKIKSLAIEMQNELYKSSDKIIDGTQSGVSGGTREIRIANSKGLLLSRTVSANVVFAEAVVSVNGESEADFAVKEYSEDLSLTDLANKATEGALSKIGAGEVKSGKYPVVISGKQMRSLLSVYSFAFNARNVQMGMSLLRGKLGEKIASDVVNLTDDPDRSTASIHFDAEGVANYRKSVIENGVLKTFLHNRESAAVDGVETTANASKASYSAPVGISPYVFCIEAGENTLDELFEMAQNGVYITELKGLHAGANAITGDFSLECEGYLIENKKRTRAVKSFTVAGNFFELLKSVTALSNDLQISVSGGSFTTFGSPDVLISEISLAGK